MKEATAPLPTTPSSTNARPSTENVNILSRCARDALHVTLNSPVCVFPFPFPSPPSSNPYAAPFLLLLLPLLLLLLLLLHPLTCSFILPIFFLSFLSFFFFLFLFPLLSSLPHPQILSLLYVCMCVCMYMYIYIYIYISPSLPLFYPPPSLSLFLFLSRFNHSFFLRFDVCRFDVFFPLPHFILSASKQKCHVEIGIFLGGEGKKKNSDSQDSTLSFSSLS